MLIQNIRLPSGGLETVNREQAFKLLAATLAACRSFKDQANYIPKWKCANCLRLKKYKINSCRSHQIDRPPHISLANPELARTDRHRRYKSLG